MLCPPLLGTGYPVQKKRGRMIIEKRYGIGRALMLFMSAAQAVKVRTNLPRSVSNYSVGNFINMRELVFIINSPHVYFEACFPEQDSIAFQG